MRIRYGWTVRQSEKIYFYALFRLRKEQMKKKWVTEISKSYRGGTLSSEEKAAVKRVWGNIPVDDKWFIMYNSIKREGSSHFDARYLPLNIHYCFIDEWFSSARKAVTVDDKNMYDLYFHDIRRPKTVFRKIKDRIMDENYKPITLEQAVQLCKNQKTVIIKPTVVKSGGKGIEFWKEEDGENTLIDILNMNSSLIVQEVIGQHPALASLHKESINTVRLMTCFFDGKMEVLSTIVRFGVGESRVDNAASGGMFCGVKEDGSLRKYAYNEYCQVFEKQPQGTVFADCKIPNFERCKELVLELSNRFVSNFRLISWDLSIAEDGEPVLIEMNLTYGDTHIHQLANGPLFGDKTEQVIAQALGNKRFRRYRHLL